MRSARAWAVRTTAQLRRPITLPVLPPPPDAPVRLLVGPANFAGQGAAWARCAERHLDGVGAQAFQVVSGPFGYPSAYAVDGDTFRHPASGTRTTGTCSPGSPTSCSRPDARCSA